MKTIQIAPYKKDCTVTKNTISGTMGDRTFVYQLAPDCLLVFDTENADYYISCFQEAIAICSKQHQIQDLLNRHFNNEGEFREV